MSFRILNAGDTALTIEFGEHIERHLLTAVAALDAALARAIDRGELHGIVETVPTFRSLTVIYDPLLCSRAEIEPTITTHADAALRSLVARDGPRRGRVWQLPVCYGEEIAACGPDLDELAQACGLAPAEVVRRHASVTYEVYMLGFQPGFAFLGDLPGLLSRPRRREPRLRVPAGSVATAGTLTAIYPWESPGGWHLLGTCPVPLFSVNWPQAALLLPGDRVRFRAVAASEYRLLRAEMPKLRAAAQPPQAFLADGQTER